MGLEITFTDSVRLLGSSLVDTTNGGAVPSGAGVTFQGTVDAQVSGGED